MTIAEVGRQVVEHLEGKALVKLSVQHDSRVLVTHYRWCPMVADSPWGARNLKSAACDLARWSENPSAWAQALGCPALIPAAPCRGGRVAWRRTFPPLPL